MNTRTSIFYGVVGLETIVSNGAIGDKAQQHEVSCGAQHRGQRCATEPLTQHSSLDIATIVHLQHSTDMSMEQLSTSYTYSTDTNMGLLPPSYTYSTDTSMGPLPPSYTYSTDMSTGPLPQSYTYIIAQT